MQSTGCTWTRDYNCHGQQGGRIGSARQDGTLGFKCCCKFKLWKKPARHNKVAKQCRNYIGATGCGWTKQYSCPGQLGGTSGLARRDGTLGYKCCCKHKLWQPSVAQ